MQSFTLSTFISATPQQIYRAWLSSEGHSQMTGSPAEVQPGVGGAFEAWDGYIHGKFLELVPFRLIIQSWRTNEFPEGSPDSRVEILLEGTADGTKLTLAHTNIPEGQAKGYKQGWEDHYFTPMRAFFSR